MDGGVHAFNGWTVGPHDRTVTTQHLAPTPTPTTAPSPAPRLGVRGVVLMLCGATSNQLGAAAGALAFDALTPVGVVAVRQWVAGLVLLVVARPRLRGFTRAQWGPVLALALVFATMNVGLYSAIDRIGLGLAVTLEFLGPLAVALLGSRRRVDLLCALLALAGVLVLLRPQPSTDWTGIALALLAAACWAGYILLNRAVGRRVPGAGGAAAASVVSAAAFVPVGAVILWHHPPTPATLALAVAAGVLASAVPMAVDLLALRRVPAHLFGLFMSIHPVLAALVGLLVLGQTLSWASWLAIGAVVGANALAVVSQGPRPGLVVAAPSRDARGMSEHPDIELEVLEDDENVPPRPEEEAADAARDEQQRP